MIKRVNILTKIFYWVLILANLMYAGVSVYSYYSVYYTFGTVPSSEDYTLEVIGTTGKAFNIFPKDMGFLIILGFIFSIIISVVFVPGLILAKHINAKIKIHSRLAFILFSMIIVLVILTYSTEALSWYPGYILD